MLPLQQSEKEVCPFCLKMENPKNDITAEMIQMWCVPRFVLDY